MNSEAAILSTMKRYPHNDLAFHLQYCKVVAVVSTTIQALPHSTLSLQVLMKPICDHHLHFHKVGFLTTDKTRGKLRIIVSLLIPSTSSKIYNVDTSFDWRSVSRLSRSPCDTKRLMFSQCLCECYQMICIHHSKGSTTSSPSVT